MNADKILQNLKDADCNQELIDRFFSFSNEGKIFEQLKLLAQHKSSLLDNLHRCQKQIDCLDYLIFNIEQEIKTS